MAIFIIKLKKNIAQGIDRHIFFITFVKHFRKEV